MKAPQSYGPGGDLYNARMVHGPLSGAGFRVLCALSRQFRFLKRLARRSRVRSNRPCVACVRRVVVIGWRVLAGFESFLLGGGCTFQVCFPRGNMLVYFRFRVFLISHTVLPVDRSCHGVLNAGSLRCFGGLCADNVRGLTHPVWHFSV